jgi:signal transduction histidine kinase
MRTYDRLVTQTAPGATPGPAGEAGNGLAVEGPGTVTAKPARDADRRLPDRPAELLARAASWYAALPPRRQEVAQDAALALSLALLNLLSLLPYQSQMHPLWLALLLVSGQCLPLAVRRVCPVPALIGCGLLASVYGAFPFGYAPLPLAPAIGFATVADRSGRLLRWVTMIGTTVGVAWSQTLPGHHQPYDAIVVTLIFVTAWVVGTLSRRRRAALAAAASRAERAEASLDEAAARAAAAERVRIARELHDVVSHHVSLMAVQAEAVGALLPARPEAAATSADLIGSTARTAMTELRRLLGVLRFQDHEDPERLRLTPVPSMSRLDELMDATRAAGLGVTHETSGPQVPLSPGVDLTAYRIIQEALTNTLRHAPGATAFVRVTYEPSHVSVEVTNTAPGRTPSQVPAAAALGRGSSVHPMTQEASASSGMTAAPAARHRAVGPGYGLAGIAERVASCGGALSLGPAGDGGFAVTARLPLT